MSAPFFMKNYYRILGTDSSATPEQIDEMYESLRRRYQVDDAADPALEGWSRGMLSELEEAYAILSDPVKRAAHDEARHPFAGLSGKKGAWLCGALTLSMVSSVISSVRCSSPIESITTFWSGLLFGLCLLVMHWDKASRLSKPKLAGLIVLLLLASKLSFSVAAWVTMMLSGETPLSMALAYAAGGALGGILVVCTVRMFFGSMPRSWGAAFAMVAMAALLGILHLITGNERSTVSLWGWILLYGAWQPGVIAILMAGNVYKENCSVAWWRDWKGTAASAGVFAAVPMVLLWLIFAPRNTGVATESSSTADVEAWKETEAWSVKFYDASEKSAAQVLASVKKARVQVEISGRLDLASQQYVETEAERALVAKGVVVDPAAEAIFHFSFDLCDGRIFPEGRRDQYSDQAMLIQPVAARVSLMLPCVLVHEGKVTMGPAAVSEKTGYIPGFENDRASVSEQRNTNHANMVKMMPDLLAALYADTIIHPTEPISAGALAFTELQRVRQGNYGSSRELARAAMAHPAPGNIVDLVVSHQDCDPEEVRWFSPSMVDGPVRETLFRMGLKEGNSPLSIDLSSMCGYNDPSIGGSFSLIKALGGTWRNHMIYAHFLKVRDKRAVFLQDGSYFRSPATVWSESYMTFELAGSARDGFHRSISTALSLFPRELGKR